MNCAGGTRPRTGCSQRISASTALTLRGVQRDLGLVVQAQLVAFHRAAQFAEQRQVFLLAGVVVLLVGREAGLVALRGVHGDVGVAHQRLRVAAVLGVMRDADAGADVERLALEEDRRFERGDDLARASRRSPVSPACRTQDGEFVAAQARDAFGAVHRVLQARAHFAQHVIAHAVSERVVDVLEAVEVHHEDGELEPAVRVPASMARSSSLEKRERLARSVSGSS